MVDSVAVFPPGFRILDSNGDPVSGAKVKFFDGGTSTPKTVYSDKDLASSLGSIVYSRSDGYLVASSGSQTTVSVFTGTALYDVIITDADDVTIYPLKQNQKGALDTSTFLTSVSTSTLSIPVVTSATDQSIGTSDRGKRRNANTASGNVAFTLAAAATLGDGWNFEMGKSAAANVALLQTTGGETIHFNGQSHTSIALSQLGEALSIRCDGTQFYVASYTPPLRNTAGVIVIADRITAAPSSPTPGARYIVTTGFSTYEAEDIIEADAVGGFIEYTPATDCGWLAYVQDEKVCYQFKTSGWARMALNIQTFEASGTYTPTPGMARCKVTSTGGGGGGGAADANDGSSAAAAGGGGAGGTCIEVFSAADVGASQTVTIGAGGAGGVASTGATGTSGGNTTFGSLHTATGGAGGTGIQTTSGAAVSGGLGGLPTGGLINVAGGDGSSGTTDGVNIALGGHGGASIWGGGGLGAVTSTTGAGTAARAFGAGGGGAAAVNSNEAAGGAGKGGIVVVEEYF